MSHVFRGRKFGQAILGPGFAAVLLMRPLQWPILTAQLAVGILAAPACSAGLTGLSGLTGQQISSGHQILSSLPVLIAAWFIWVICLNGGTLAFNSAYDRDIHDIAYLRSPPEAPAWLAGFAVVTMLVGLVGGLLLAPVFGLLTLLCVVLSILYSHPAVRWKAVPGADLAVNMIGYGGGTTLAGLLAGQLACGGPGGLLMLLRTSIWPLVGGFALLFGSFYPLTQIYQLRDDRKRGDRTLASALGIRSALLLAQVLGWAATACFLVYVAGQRPAFAAEGIPIPLSILIVLPACLAWQAHIIRWWRLAPAMTDGQHEKGMYRALVLWAVVDLAILAGLYAEPLLRR